MSERSKFEHQIIAKLEDLSIKFSDQTIEITRLNESDANWQERYKEWEAKIAKERTKQVSLRKEYQEKLHVAEMRIARERDTMQAERDEM